MTSISRTVISGTVMALVASVAPGSGAEERYKIKYGRSTPAAGRKAEIAQRQKKQQDHQVAAKDKTAAPTRPATTAE